VVPERVNDRGSRILQQTKGCAIRSRSALILDEHLVVSSGSLFDMWTAITTMATTHIRLHTIGDQPYIMARALPVDLRLYRRYESTPRGNVCPETLSRPPDPGDEEGSRTLP